MAFKYKVAPGDTLNQIANRYGFANYKLAGVSSVPSGNFDLIRPGEEITLGNYNPQEIKSIGSTDPIITSEQNAGEYKDLASSLDKKINPPPEGNFEEYLQQIADQNPELADEMMDKLGYTRNSDKSAEQKDTKEIASGDKLYDEYLKGQETLKTGMDTQKAEKEAEIKALLPKTLALIDAQYAATTSNITNTYSKLLTEQQRINQVNVDRTKAYGLGAGGQYMPLEFTSAVSEQEQKAANAISTLENERNDLLAQAKASRDQGEISALRDNMDALNKVEETMRQRTKDLSAEVQKRYELTQAVRKEQESKFQERANKTLEAAKIKYLKDFQNAKTEEDKVKVIRKVILDSAGTLTNDDFYSIYSSLNSAVMGAGEVKTKAEKEAADLEYKKAQTKKEIIDAKKAEADIKTPEEKAAEKEMARKKSESEIEENKAQADAARALAEERRKGKDPTPAEVTKENVKNVVDTLNSVSGADGFISPNDWKKAKQLWVREGYGTAAEFDKTFDGYMNPNNPEYWKQK